VFFIIIGIVLIGFIYLYFNFLMQVNEEIKTIELEEKNMPRQFLAVGILLVLVNILGGLFMLFNAYDLGTYIGRVADLLDIKMSTIRIRLMQTIGCLIFADVILFIIYKFIFTRSSLSIIMLAIIAISIVLPRSIAFILSRRLLELYRVYRRE